MLQSRWDREVEGERKRERERDRDREIEIEIESERERERARERGREREREREMLQTTQVCSSAGFYCYSDSCGRYCRLQLLFQCRDTAGCPLRLTSRKVLQNQRQLLIKCGHYGCCCECAY